MMYSTLNKTMEVVNGVMKFVPCKYPNWYGISDIGFIWHNTQTDPELEYKGKLFNAHDIEDAMYDDYCSYCEDFEEDVTETGFEIYMIDNSDEVHELLDRLIVNKMED